MRAAAVWATLATVLLTVGSGRPAAKATTSVPLHVLLTLSSNLPVITRHALISEAERIWRHEQVNIEWGRPGHTVEHSSAPLRVLVVARPHAARAPGDWPVAQLFPDAAPRALAVASIESAQRVVDEASRLAAAGDGAPREQRLGLVLGRAVAHEIGHFLLATGTHAESGLMRGSIDAREFAAVGGEAFRLDRDASQWLRHRLARSLSDGSQIQAERFSYLRPPVLLEQITN